jgi:hypothetical protein
MQPREHERIDVACLDAGTLGCTSVMGPEGQA